MAFSFSPSLVIFDCDGVLVDTEPVANRALARFLGECGFEISYEECRRLFVGRTMQAVQAHVEDALGRPLGSDWPARIRDETLKAFAQGIEPVAGAQALLQELAAREKPYCVASSGRFEKMRFTLGATGLLPLVEDVLFSAEEVAQGKPAPDLFLHAAVRMGHAPENCLVIEDSVPGVQAGVAAGMSVIGYAGDPMTDAAALKREGAHVISDMSALLDLFSFR
ncbi:HAD family phosphatase [Parvibaculum sp.]|jgi:HAD superfamily hydrolase (TIGR01509 family)|uniref:HAD family hydrolase n=1 Tax=Parvibaculum sp. TaxID=2024848 RepID=UPI000C380259|nr:HAD family phosphatase [Parvibaculum sp.]MAM94257.1 HAD family hydrolase [Parvibaculum sp.]|tara:strand:+ start:14928 stop:15596 length:669 start_codon:yes stop_codon:yes gene_type:complete